VSHRLWSTDTDTPQRDGFTYEPIPFGPHGSPDARHEIVKSWEPAGFSYMSLSSRRDRGLDQGVMNSDAQVGQMHFHMLKASPIYWVAPGMCDLLVEAARTIQVDRSLSPDLIPAQNRIGLCFFASTLAGQGLDIDGDQAVPVDALHWYPSVRVDPQGKPHFVLSIDSYGGARLLVGPMAGKYILYFAGGSEWELGEHVDEEWDPVPGNPIGSLIEDRKLLLTLLSLIESPGVADVVEMPLDRPTRRRMERADASTDAVRVVYLRGSRATTHAEHAEESRYQHQWIVSGHWRQQPYGPSRSLRRQVWIAPYIKGPTDAPLLTGEKVMAIVR